MAEEINKNSPELEETPVVEEKVNGEAKKEKVVIPGDSYFTPKGIHLDMLRYRPNKLAYLFSILAFGLLALGFCVFYSGTEFPTESPNFNLFGSHQPGPWLGIDIVLNIVIMLIMLLTAIRLKNYSVQFGFTSIVIGAWQIVRLFIFPMALLLDTINTKYVAAADGTVLGLKVEVFVFMAVCFVISGLLSIAAGLFTIFRGRALVEYLKTVDPIENDKVGK